LAEDLGAALGTVAHLAALRRTASGGFSLANAATLEELQGMDPGDRKTRLLSLKSLLGGLPRAELDAAAAARFRNGQAVPLEGAGAVFGVYGPDGGVIGLGRADGAGKLHPLRLTAASQAAE
jgi:tRNA pseudouridine55 synthase